MQKNKRVILFLTLICLCIFIMQVFVGCSNNYTTPKDTKMATESDIIKYVAENFDKYRSRIKDESGVEGKVVNGIINGKEEKYIEFDIDNDTKIKFVVTSTVRITKQFEPSQEFNYTREIEMVLFGMREDDDIRIKLRGNGSISCDYKANDLEHPLPSQKEKDECIDSQIKQNISTKELEKLSSKAHSIYKVFEKICNEYNEKNQK
ncbi:hypothetical protein HBE96_12855 [Clostridium sp. P21]|uniref:Lipoprotein n=1 Tax=Clostridium muellerianum TaxID=2716538 RepID=A0A7Y0EHH6_9CLOT|nr:hypothetical protein [Clostridium muellerianum]NMM63548.1 hypothetical protein [Clostridium muellerianum]